MNYFEANAGQLDLTVENMQSRLNDYNLKITTLYNTVDKIKQSWVDESNKKLLQKIYDYKDTTAQVGKSIQDCIDTLSSLSSDLDKIAELKESIAGNYLNRGNENE